MAVDPALRCRECGEPCDDPRFVRCLDCLEGMAEDKADEIMLSDAAEREAYWGDMVLSYARSVTYSLSLRNRANEPN